MSVSLFTNPNMMMRLILGPKSHAAIKSAGRILKSWTIHQNSTWLDSFMPRSYHETGLLFAHISPIRRNGHCPATTPFQVPQWALMPL